MIVNFDPTNESAMRALCKQWTEGSPPVFAVLDGAGVVDRRQRAVHHPGRPHAVHRAMDDGDQLDPGGRALSVVDGARPGPDPGHGGGVGDRPRACSTPQPQVGIVAGDRTSDQVALNQYLLPDLRRAGLHRPAGRDPPVEPVRHRRDQLRRAARRAAAEGGRGEVGDPAHPLQLVLPLPAQETRPELLPQAPAVGLRVLDPVTLGLIPIPYEQGLDGQEGVTVETLGGTDAPARREPRGRLQPRRAELLRHVEGAQQADVVGVALHRGAGPDRGLVPGHPAVRGGGHRGGPRPQPAHLRRRPWRRIQNFSGTYTPTLSFGPDKFSGPTEYQIVELTTTIRPSPLCVPTYTGKPQGTCWHVVQSWTPLAA